MKKQKALSRSMPLLWSPGENIIVPSAILTAFSDLAATKAIIVVRVFLCVNQLPGEIWAAQGAKLIALSQAHFLLLNLC